MNRRTQLHRAPDDSLKIVVQPEEGAPPQSFTLPADSSQTITLPQSAAAGKGLHTVETTLLRNGTPVWTYRSAFWIRDWTYLQSGPEAHRRQRLL